MYDYRDYLAFSKRLYHLAEEETGDVSWLLVPAVLLCWIAIEALVNSIVDDFNSLPEDMFELHERAFMLEKRLILVDKGPDLGKFILDNRSEYRRLEERIFFLIRKFGKEDSNYKGTTLWQEFEELKDVRNKLVHPRRDDEINLTVQNVSQYIQTSEGIIGFISTKVWGRPASV